MTISFPNSARSYDETKQRIRFLGHDGMFEIKFFISADALCAEKSRRTSSERDYLEAFDTMRGKILDVAKKVYARHRQATIMLDARDFS